MVELPLALPVDPRRRPRRRPWSASGTATIAAAIGAGGLGEYIFRGLSMVDPPSSWPAPCPRPRSRCSPTARSRWLRAAARRRAPAPVAAQPCRWRRVAAGRAGRRRRGAARGARERSRRRLEELHRAGRARRDLAQTLERDAGLPVDRRLNLGGTFICDRALRAGDIDVYVEYTGTALTADLQAAGRPRDRRRRARHRPRALCASGPDDAAAARLQQHVRDPGARRATRERSGCARSPTPRRTRARWRAGFGYEFLEREDGFPGLARAYGLRFAEPPRVMDLSLTYRALPAGRST